jgi:hypothetical protein
MLVKEINNDETLTYKIFIDKGIFLIDKICNIIDQYKKIEENTDMLIEQIKKRIRMNSIEKENYEKIDINDKLNKMEIKDEKDIIKNIAEKLHNLDLYINNYIKKFKNKIYHISLNIKKIYKKDDKEFFSCYETEIKEINMLISKYEKNILNDNLDELFERIINISNIYILVTKIIISINIIIKLGELLKIENKELKSIYENL